MLIEETKDSHYGGLQKSGERWHKGQNDAAPFIAYMLGILLTVYIQSDERRRRLFYDSDTILIMVDQSSEVPTFSIENIPFILPL